MLAHLPAIAVTAAFPEFQETQASLQTTDLHAFPKGPLGIFSENDGFCLVFLGVPQGFSLFLLGFPGGRWVH